jgi:hypothetical protein
MGSENNLIKKAIIIEICILVVINIYFFCTIIFDIKIHPFGIFLEDWYFLYWLFIIICFFKLMIAIKNIAVLKIFIPKIHISSILQIAFSLFYLYFTIDLLLVGYSKFVLIGVSKIQIIIPIFIIVIGQLMFQLYLINYSKYKYLKIFSNIITTITSFIIICGFLYSTVP